MRALPAAPAFATHATEGVEAFETLVVLQKEQQQQHRNSNGTSSSSSNSSKGFNLLYLIPILIGALLVLALVFWLVWRYCRNTKRSALKRTESALMPIVNPSALLLSPSQSRDDDRELVQSLNQHDSSALATWRASESLRGSSVNNVAEQFRQSVTDAQSRQLYRRLHGDPNVSAYRLAFQKIVFERMLSSRSSLSNMSTRTWLCQYEGEEIAVKVLYQPSVASVRRRKSLRLSTSSSRASGGDGGDSDGHMNRYEDLRRLVGEIQLTAALEHPHVIRFLGVAWDSMTVESLCLITEYLSMGNLQEHLRGAKNLGQGQEDDDTWGQKKLGFAIGIARALQYLHSCKLPPFSSSTGDTSATTTPPTPVTLLHRDVRAKNVGLSHTCEPKLVNIGAKHGYDNPEIVAMGDGNAFWTAPEVLSGRAYLERADIYAFGVLLSEIDTNGQAPYNDRASAHLRPFQVLNQVAAGTLRPAFSASCPPRIREIAALCLRNDPEERVDAATLTQLLESYDKSLAQ